MLAVGTKYSYTARISVQQADPFKYPIWYQIMSNLKKNEGNNHNDTFAKHPKTNFLFMTSQDM